MAYSQERTMRLRRRFAFAVVIVAPALLLAFVSQPDVPQGAAHSSNTAQITGSAYPSRSHLHKQLVPQPQPTKTIAKQSVPSPAPLGWRKPTGSQPNLKGVGNLNVSVNLGAQTVDIRNESDVLYTMVASTGVDDSTPRGDFTISQRGSHFYNANEGMGAKTWTAFIGTTYLFHSVPTDIDGDFIESEAEKLGKPASHGCVRLTVADAQWFYDSIPDGTPVHIE